MPHDCTDWTKNPPCRKAPYFLLRRGDEYIYTVVPNDLKALQDIARKEFHLGDADIELTSSCGNLWNGEPARITEGAWALVSACIGCATVEVVGENAVPPQAQPPPGNAPDAVVPERPPSDPVAGVAEREPVQAPVDHDMDDDRAPTPENRRQEDEDEENMGSPRKARYQRRVVSDDEGEPSEPEDRDASARPQVPVAASPERMVKKERQSEPHSDQGSQLTDQLDILDKPVKQEMPDTYSRAESQSETLVQAPTESTESNKLMIRVAHRPSQQESKFTTKSTTKVHKVLAGVCKSFGLDVSRATLYLIVSTTDDRGEEENLFPCDKNDSIARAGAEHDMESKFLLKIAGEP